MYVEPGILGTTELLDLAARRRVVCQPARDDDTLREAELNAVDKVK